MRVKICGVTRPETVEHAVAAGAAYLGFNFFPPSPRSVNPPVARELALLVRPGIAKVGLFVDPDEAALAEILGEVPLDMLQLHGAESPARVAELRAAHGLPVMKVIGVRDAEDLSQIPDYAAVADQLLIDAKPPRDAVLPGGNGLAFDWSLIAGRRWPIPWMLAGGLTPDNVAEAVRLTGANQVDVASGVESAPGIKSPEKIAAFIEAAGQ